MLPHLCGFIPNGSFADKRTLFKQICKRLQLIHSLPCTPLSHIILPMFAICSSSRIFSRRAFSSGGRFFWPYAKPPMWCSTLEVFTKFGTASDKVFYVLPPRILYRSISRRQIQPHLRVGSLLPSQLARLPVNAAPDPVCNISPVSFGVEFQRLLQRGCHISG